VRTHAARLGLACLGEVESPLTGPSGNHEFFLHLRVPAIEDWPAPILDAPAAGEP